MTPRKPCLRLPAGLVADSKTSCGLQTKQGEKCSFTCSSSLVGSGQVECKLQSKKDAQGNSVAKWQPSSAGAKCVPATKAPTKVTLPPLYWLPTPVPLLPKHTHTHARTCSPQPAPTPEMCMARYPSPPPPPLRARAVRE